MMFYSQDAITAIHEAALTTLENLGMKMLLPEARQQFRAGGAKVDDASEMLWIDRDMVASALETAPHATDLERGRRPGTGRDFRELARLTKHFDVLHMIPPLIEPQNVPLNLRRYFIMSV
jgi:trimethylamine--corrinoid protein Co-methyltransferase